MSTKNKFGVGFCIIIIAASVLAVLAENAGAFTEQTAQALAYLVGGIAPMAFGGLGLFTVFRLKSMPDPETGW